MFVEIAPLMEPLSGALLTLEHAVVDTHAHLNLEVQRCVTAYICSRSSPIVLPT